MTEPAMIPPGSTIGILGGGQLGRMLAIAAAQLGYRTHIFAPEASGPAAEVSVGWTRADYRDEDALAAFAKVVHVVTYEFENVPVAGLPALGAKLRPCARALEIAQDRAAEKAFAASLGIATAPWHPVDDRAGLDAALGAIGTPAILKTRRFGYDGKGQVRLSSDVDADAAWAAVGGQPAILEGRVVFDHEFSILAVRAGDGTVEVWDAPENNHADGILARSRVPARTADDMLTAAIGAARRIAAALDYIGVLACEFFAGAGGPIFNEMAPRVHNSGHWTIEGAVTSQFENHIRAICGLPLGATERTAPAVEMENLIGDEVERWPAILAERSAHLHLYGKHEARTGRKMGHVTRLLRD